MTGSKTIRAKLEYLYGPDQGAVSYERLASMLDDFKVRYNSRAHEDRFVTERDIILITYGDMVTQPEAAPLATLNDFLTMHLHDTINTVHVLPFFPYSSDDGFSVINYRQVNPKLGTWGDIEQLGRNFNLMFDAVINHVSARSEWFQGFLQGDERYRDYFITVDPNTDLSTVVRPRAKPLLTRVETSRGEEYVWTTFSADQIDLNCATPDMLLEIVNVLLHYIERGAKIIRLDAIAYLWKEIGTSCIHLPQTHAVVQLLRAIVDNVAPGVLIITETNVPHEENISYLGDGTNEAHLVYQFSLPPLIAHTILSGSARKLREWAEGLEILPGHTTFFNFTASHDGIGIRPVEGILSDDELNALVEHTHANGGDVSYKTNADGSVSPYELNIVYYDLLNPSVGGEPLDLQVQRFLVSQAIMLALVGVPGIYFHSLVGSRNYNEGVKQTGQARTINREKLRLDTLVADLSRDNSVRHAVFYSYKRLIQKRVQMRAFHPKGPQRILPVGDSIFGLLRRAPAGDEAVIALHNVSADSQAVTLDLRTLGLDSSQAFVDILSDRLYTVERPGTLVVGVEPYQICWLSNMVEITPRPVDE